jgi:hypothetical protein
MTPTAQDVYDDMLRVGIRPRLRALGFTGSGSTFVWPCATAAAQLGFQKSAFSDRDAVKFTVNVTVADFVSWEQARIARPHLPKHPAPNTKYGSFIWQQRIGKLLPEGEDRWWWLQADGDWTSVADEVVDAIATYIVPELRARTVT